jgi:hypothetical protein
VELLVHRRDELARYDAYARRAGEGAGAQRLPRARLEAVHVGGPELKERIEKQLKSGGLEWGVVGNELVVTLVNKRFINAEIPNLTRYGEREEIQLPAGQYTLTCVGLIPEGGLSVDKVLSKGAYFNEDVLSFTIEPGETTVLQVSSVIRKENTFLLKFFVPEVSVNVIANDVEFGAMPMNLRGDASSAWDDYFGPLKFVAK